MPASRSREGEPEQAERDAHDALACSSRHRGVPGRFGHSRNPRGSDQRRRKPPRSRPAFRRGRRHAPSARARCALRSTKPDTKRRWRHFEMRWTIRTSKRPGRRAPHCRPSEAIAYAQRGRGERKRPSSGWASLTPAELDVVRLVSEGLGNKDIAARLFVSPRTVQSHLTRVYTKLGLTSRVQLAQEADPPVDPDK